MKNINPNKANSFISEEEKKQLKERIDSSIFSLKRKRTRRKYTSGFTLLVVVAFAIGFYIKQNKESNIEGYLQTADKVNVESFNKVKLILNDKNEINIQQDSATISYSKTGGQVKIGNNNVIALETKNNTKTNYNTVVVPYGKRTKIELSDGTMVWLNSGSKLIYPIVFNNDKREVYIEGEGIFDVAHNKNHPFIVVAKNHEIEVLGTVFNVSNYTDEDIISTTLKSGSVKINYLGDSYLKLKKSIKIKPGIAATYNKNSKSIQAKKVDIADCFSWREGLFFFRNDNLEFIMKKLSRYYNVKITIENENLIEETFSGQLDLKEDISEVLKLIKETNNLEFNYSSDKKIIIN
ncbi:FecR domain-containing protein [uncultured Maribacter sp.]|uniref:FecR family protein n=1 Tax=uncultured Maribacter sp. TaxID=431308 RepID=UPI0026355458|nr:FecR domain-containing protein [uncultured Maribacter sp.]